MQKNIDDLARERATAKAVAASKQKQRLQQAEVLAREAAEQLAASLSDALKGDPAYYEVQTAFSDIRYETEFVWLPIRAVGKSKLVYVELGTGVAWQVSDGIQLGFGSSLPLRGLVRPNATSSILAGSAEFEYVFANAVLIAPPRLGVDPTTLHHHIAMAVKRL